MSRGEGLVARPLVVGLGSTDRGDDGVGCVVVGAVAAMGLPGLAVVTHEDPTALIDLWEGHDPVVVVDAVVAGDAPGSLHRLHTGATLPALPTSGWEATGRGGTHAFNLGSAVELARALGRLPQHLAVVGVEAASFDHGAGLSPPVSAQLDAVVEAVLEEIHVAVAFFYPPVGTTGSPQVGH